MLFFIYGTDHYRVGEKLNELKTSFIEKRDKTGINVISLDGSDLEFDTLRQEMMTTPFLGEKKMIIIRNIFSGKKQYKEMVKFFKDHEKKIDNVICFIDYLDGEKYKKSKNIQISNDLFRYLKKQKFNWELNLLPIWEIEKWIKNYCSDKKIKIDSQAIKELSTLVGNDLHQLVLEIDKLTAYKKDDEINKNDVIDLVHGKYEENIFELIDAIAGKNKKQAISLIEKQILAGSHPLMVLSMITRQFKILLKIKDQNITAKDAGIHPYILKKATAQSKNFEQDKLINIHNELIKLESKLKFGAKNPELLFEMFVIKNC